MNLAEALQLYTPLAGLVMMAFWVGALSQRVRSLETVVKRYTDDEGPGGSWERLVRLEEAVKSANGQLESINRTMGGIQRQIGNLMMKPGTLQEFGAPS